MEANSMIDDYGISKNQQVNSNNQARVSSSNKNPKTGAGKKSKKKDKKQSTSKNDVPEVTEDNDKTQENINNTDQKSATLPGDHTVKVNNVESTMKSEATNVSCESPLITTPNSTPERVCKQEYEEQNQPMMNDNNNENTKAEFCSVVNYEFVPTHLLFQDSPSSISASMNGDSKIESESAITDAIGFIPCMIIPSLPSPTSNNEVVQIIAIGPYNEDFPAHNLIYLANNGGVVVNDTQHESIHKDMSYCLMPLNTDSATNTISPGNTSESVEDKPGGFSKINDLKRMIHAANNPDNNNVEEEKVSSIPPSFFANNKNTKSNANSIRSSTTMPSGTYFDSNDAQEYLVNRLLALNGLSTDILPSGLEVKIVHL
eukprot:CAMPEP_0178948416 /NCGR_PEP_ID=MMETSP0789-20121207/5465_1 /TAXON_ID=3005 /ORGANISM="Rhizosolenia setigera, Strain CCMP 1694" /LENGTH=372 /DNA_ID=CAMNT_0020628789 /DNA_START=236 /DNA_END=1356 /DNA_ORIENTATION=+